MSKAARPSTYKTEGGHRPVVNTQLAGDELHGDVLVLVLAGHRGGDELVQLLRVLLDGLLVGIVLGRAKRQSRATTCCGHLLLQCHHLLAVAHLHGGGQVVEQGQRQVVDALARHDG